MVPFRVVLLTIFLFPGAIGAAAAAGGDYVPVVYRIGQKQTECIYDKFDKSDFVTYSVFVVDAMNNGTPQASIGFEGPVAGNQLNASDEAPEGVRPPKLGRELREGTQDWPRIKDADKATRYDKRIGLINRSLKVDWTHAGESEDAVVARAQLEREKKEYYRNSQSRMGREDTPEYQHDKFRTIHQSEIEPFEETNAIKAEGWYRLCVSADYHALRVEMDLRSGKELGGVDRTTGHVYTREAREALDEEKLLDEVEEVDEDVADFNTYASLDEEKRKELENQVREHDLSASKAQMKHLNTMVMQMKKKHVDFHHRIKSHQATARRNYDSLVWSSKLETLLYVAIMGVQVYTIRRWLLSNSLLGS